jgi:hypothetical protein
VTNTGTQALEGNTMGNTPRTRAAAKAMADRQLFNPYNRDDAEWALAHPGQDYLGYMPTEADLAVCRTVAQ